MSAIKFCPKCKQDKLFSKGLGTGGLQTYCKDCSAEYGAAWAKTEKGKASLRKSRLRHYYGITDADYERFLLSQNGKCAICGQVPDLRRLDVDHNHISGEVRGLLCNQCNQAIGLFQDNVELLSSAIAYLKKLS